MIMQLAGLGRVCHEIDVGIAKNISLFRSKRSSKVTRVSPSMSTPESLFALTTVGANVRLWLEKRGKNPPFHKGLRGEYVPCLGIDYN